MSLKTIRITHPGGLRSGMSAKVFLDGVDVSHNVTEVEITITPDKLPVVKITVIDVEIDVSSTDPDIDQWVAEGGRVTNED
jgi:hypothetical protein